jgi:hypothetical protein
MVSLLPRSSLEYRKLRPVLPQLQPNSIESNEDEDDKQTEGAMVKRLVFYFDLHVAWDSTINRKQYTRANSTQ